MPLVTAALGDLRVNPFGLPSEWLWSNYLDILFGDRYWRQTLNSLFIAAVTVVLTIIVAAMEVGSRDRDVREGLAQTIKSITGCEAKVVSRTRFTQRIRDPGVED
ncbi:ABC-type Fe3+ transport system permease subunit [Ensifer mexicanus]|nr:ABC-type Fe3+ transport system permease subunit [Sinorhizobium mexicanum]